jgi:hypothetical protein
MKTHSFIAGMAIGLIGGRAVYTVLALASPCVGCVSCSAPCAKI